MQTRPAPERQERATPAPQLDAALTQFLTPLLVRLDVWLDARVVRTAYDVVVTIIRWRHSTLGLLLSELGGYLMPPGQAPAGAKRIGTLVRSDRWQSRWIDEHLWQQAEQRVQTGEATVVVWDESVWEKPETVMHTEFGSVRSSVAARLKHIRPGYYQPPTGRPICVPGLSWLGLLVVGTSGPPTVAAWRWWSNRGTLASNRRQQERQMLTSCQTAWGRRVIHCFDRGFAGGPWLTTLIVHDARFILRWPTGYKLVDAQGQKRLAWQITRGKRSRATRMIRRQGQRVTLGLYWCPVHHPDVAVPLWLVVSRRGKGQRPWYLLTNESITTADEALAVVLGYARRWQVEMAWRFCKSELAFESPRCWSWEADRKLLMLASLAYAFLLSLLLLPPLVADLLQHWCHRTGTRCQQSLAPLYRLRSAVGRLWDAYPPLCPPLAKFSG
jgi:hypothetical protein